MDTVGFIGLGKMGVPMARNLVEAGFPLTVWNRTESKAEDFVGEGVTVADSPRDLAGDSDVVIIMVAGPDDVLEVLERDDGVLAGTGEGDLVMQMSTISREATLEAAELVEERGAAFVDAPVSGTVGPAREGTLTMLAGASDGDFYRVEPLLKAMGEPVMHTGDIGSATDMKLFVNLLLGQMMQSYVEAMVFGKKHGLETDQMNDLIESGPLDAPLFSIKGDLIRSGDFEPRFPVKYVLKDLGLALDAAEREGIPLPGGAAAWENAASAKGMGLEEEDITAVVKVLEEIAGVKVRD